MRFRTYIEPTVFARFSLPLSLIVCIALAISPFLSGSFGIVTGYHNKQRIAEAACLSYLLFGALPQFVRKDKINLHLSRHLARYLTAFFLIGFFSCLNAYSLRYAFFEWATFLLLVLLAWNIAIEIRAKQGRIIPYIFNAAGLGCVLYLLNVGIIYLAVMNAGTQVRPDIFIFGFDNYRFFNHVQTISLPILGLLVMRSEVFGKRYWFWFAACSLWWTMLFVAAGRGTFIGLIAGIALTGFFRRKLAIGWCRMMAFTLLAGAGVYLMFFTIIPGLLGLEPFGFSSQIVRRTIASPTSGRDLLWQLAWEMIREHPWLGAGPLHFAHYGPAVDYGAHPHNWVLQIASEWGVPALICLIAAIGLAFRALISTGCLIQSDDVANQTTLCAWITIGTAILVDGLVSGLIVMPTSQLWIALYIGCAWGWASLLLPSPPSFGAVRGGSRTISFGVTGALVIALGLFWYGLFPEITNLQAFEVEALKSDMYPYGTLRPRIWAAGYF